MPVGGEKIRLLTSLKGFFDYHDAEEYSELHHTHDYDSYEVLKPGEYIVFGPSAGKPWLVNISKEAGVPGWWIDWNENVEPPKFKVEHGYRGYDYYHDAEVKNDTGWTLIPPGEYYVYGYFGGNPDSNLVNITPTAGEVGKWINRDLGDNQEPEKIEIYEDINAYINVDNAYQGKGGFTLPKGTYYCLFYSDDEKLAYVSYLNLPMGPGQWIVVADNKKTVKYDKIKVNLPMEAYKTVKGALDQNKDEAMKIPAGTYYVISEHENGKVIRIAKAPDPNEEEKYLNQEVNEKNLEKDNTDGSSTKNPEAANTGTTTGIDNKPKKKGSLTGKDPETVFLAGGYDTAPAFIKNLVTGTTIELRMGLPDSISDSASANFDPASVRGRSNQIQGYDYTDGRQVSFDYTFHEELEPEGLLTTLARIKALEYPGYASVVEPPKCYLRLGNAVRGTFICTDASVSYRDDAGTRDEYYLAAEVSFSFIEANDFARSAAEIEDGGGMLM